MQLQVAEIVGIGPYVYRNIFGRTWMKFWSSGSILPDQTKNESGLGLGLFIVREIAHAHGGSVEVRLKDGKTIFSVQLPRHYQEPASNLSQMQS